MDPTLRHKVDQMKAALKNGSLVVSGRNSGKTLALLELFYELPLMIVVLHNESARKRFLDMYQERYGELPANKKGRVLNGSSNKVQDDLKYRNNWLYNVYIDEREMNPYKGPYWSAISTFDKPLVIL
jgi:hypothetical protein